MNGWKQEAGSHVQRALSSVGRDASTPRRVDDMASYRRRRSAASAYDVLVIAEEYSHNL